MNASTVIHHCTDYVQIKHNETEKSIHVTKIQNRVIVFTLFEHELAVMLISRDYGSDDEALHNKFLHIIAKMALKEPTSKYYTKCRTLHFNNGAGKYTVDVVTRQTIINKAWKLLEYYAGTQD